MPDAPTSTTGGSDLAQPRSLWHLFVAFSVLALQGFGGVIAVAQRELCERRRWLTPQDFVELLSGAQVLPGPNVCNLSLMIGDRFFGWRGALVALSGMIAAPMALMLLLAWLLGEASHVAQVQGLIKGALGGIAAVAAGQIVGTVLKLAAPIKDHVLGWPTCAALAALAFSMMAFLHWPLVWVLLGLGSLTCTGTYLLLRRRALSAPRSQA
ncbi:MAG TPA: chromate transporter [Aquabacterium sp.]|uniref:chromate transporter n=1 Tax=Aquabacterium sp. TaxID=1872578 RepID=UPI002E2F8792|nr:chromate transporter [Aquabacterium sp.]HEX5355473.1 chromate transporter [Aquabacterium sp.]